MISAFELNYFSFKIIILNIAIFQLLKMIKGKLNIKEILSSRISLHILFWLFLLIYSTFFFGYPDHLKGWFFTTLYILPADIAFVYLTIYFLTPKFLLKKRFILFSFLFLLFGYIDELIIRIIGVVFFGKTTHVLGNFFGGKGVWNLFSNYYYALLALAIKLARIWYRNSIETQQITEEKYQAELKLREAELKLLKAQIHPHFLFNTLNNLYGLTLERSKKAPEVVIKLSALLDYVLYKCNTATVLLSNEIGHIINYIELEKIRYDDSLTVSFKHKGEPEDKRIAPLLLLPFIENCFKHGVSKSSGNSWINFDFNIENEKLHFKVENSKTDFQNSDRSKYSEGIGLNNVKQRLELAYKNKYFLKIEDKKNVFSVILDIDLSLSENTVQK